jgi:surfeit locus 1 family protein
MHKRYFHPHLIPTLAMLAGMVLFVNLGLWQAGKGDRRADELAQHAARAKHGAVQVLAELLPPEQVQDFPVVVRGMYEPEQQFFVDNRQEGGKPGLHVITPLRISGSQTRVLVNRGWIGWGQSRDVLPQVPVPGGEVQVNGVAHIPGTKKFFLMPEHADEKPTLWSRPDLQRYAKTSGHTVQNFLILQNQSDTSDTLLRHWPPPEDRVAMHESYALQWFSMAAGLLFFWMAASVRKSDVADTRDAS